MARPTTPTREAAQGMLTALSRGHECTEACTGATTLGDGHVIQLTCPYKRLDVDSETDRRIIGSIYAIEARAALAQSGGAR